MLECDSEREVTQWCLGCVIKQDQRQLRRLICGRPPKSSQSTSPPLTQHLTGSLRLTKRRALNCRPPQPPLKVTSVTAVINTWSM